MQNVQEPNQEIPTWESLVNIQCPTEGTMPRRDATWSYGVGLRGKVIFRLKPNRSRLIPRYATVTKINKVINYGVQPDHFPVYMIRGVSNSNEWSSKQHTCHDMLDSRISIWKILGLSQCIDCPGRYVVCYTVFRDRNLHCRYMMSGFASSLHDTS